MAGLDDAPNVGQDFEKAHDGVAENPPSTPNKTYELTPGGTLEQTVHTQLDDAARMAESGKSDDQGDAAKAFKKHLLLRREFTRVRGHEHDEGR